MKAAAKAPEESPSSSTAASDAETATGMEPAASSRMTLSGASGKHLAGELQRWMNTRRREEDDDFSPEARSLWAKCELGVTKIYDQPFSGAFNFVYDVLQLSSGRDKFCAFVQGFAKFGSAALCEANSEQYFMYRGIEDSISDGRKVLRLFKELREVYKVRRGVQRFLEGVRETGLCSVPAVCGTLDMAGHSMSLLYYLFDNLLWAASVGIIRSQEVPRWQRGWWKGPRADGLTLTLMGGVKAVKRRKNTASIWRLVFAITANVLLLFKAVERLRKDGLQGPDDPRLYHTLELVGMFANFRILLSRLGYSRASHARLGLLAMLAAACGIWANWRKVLRKHCGSKSFPPLMNKRRHSRSL